MGKNIKKLEFFIELEKFNSVISRKFDSRLGGISFNWFIILYHLKNSPNLKLRRVDLAEKVGLTASGVTRILLPMEKIGLVRREANEMDGRVSYVSLSPGGKRKLEEVFERAEVFMDEIIPEGVGGKIDGSISLLKTVLGNLH